MVFISDANGTLIQVVNTTVYQGSFNAAEVVLIAPFSQSNVVTVSYVLPNGVSLSPVLLSPLGQLDGMQDAAGNTLSAWSVLLGAAVAEWSGTVTASFLVSIPSGDGKAAGGRVSTTTFEVSRGVYIAPPDTPTASLWEDILTQLATANGKTDTANASLASLARRVSALEVSVAGKLDKVTSATSNTQAYVKRPDGSQGLEAIPTFNLTNLNDGQYPGSLESPSGNATGDNAVSIGGNSTAAENGFVVGSGASAGENGFAVGSGASAAADAVAMGQNANATENAIAIGPNTETTGYGIAIGAKAKAVSTLSGSAYAPIAIGVEADGGVRGVSIGAGAGKNNNGGVSIGENANAGGGIAIGTGTSSLNIGTAIGNGVSVYGLGGLGIGYLISAVLSRQTVLGFNPKKGGNGIGAAQDESTLMFKVGAGTLDWPITLMAIDSDGTMTVPRVAVYSNSAANATLQSFNLVPKQYVDGAIAAAVSGGGSGGTTEPVYIRRTMDGTIIIPEGDEVIYDVVGVGVELDQSTGKLTLANISGTARKTTISELYNNIKGVGNENWEIDRAMVWGKYTTTTNENDNIVYVASCMYYPTSIEKLGNQSMAGLETTTVYRVACTIIYVDQA